MNMSYYVYSVIWGRTASFRLYTNLQNLLPGVKYILSGPLDGFMWNSAISCLFFWCLIEKRHAWLEAVWKGETRQGCIAGMTSSARKRCCSVCTKRVVVNANILLNLRESALQALQTLQGRRQPKQSTENACVESLCGNIESREMQNIGLWLSPSCGKESLVPIRLIRLSLNCPEVVDRSWRRTLII